MSLAMFAAPFNDNSNNDLMSNNSDDIINKKKQIHNKTQKKYPKENFDTDKVNSILEKIHTNSKEDDDKNQFGDFSPPPKPESAGVNKTISTEQMMNMTNKNDLMFRTLGRAPQPNYDAESNLDLNDYKNYGDNKSSEEYYKKFIPGYTPPHNPVNKPYYNTNYIVPEQNTDNILLQKLNYMISLLEDQQDEKTNNVTEEVVLYSFLGIFIIFIVDSFARAGKYVR
jgi:hypothetical protein